MVETKDKEAVMFVNSKAGFSRVRIILGVDHLIYDQQYQHGGRTSITYYQQYDVSMNTN